MGAVTLNRWGPVAFARSQLPDEAYRAGVGVTGVEPGPGGDGVTVVLGDGGRGRYDASPGRRARGRRDPSGH